MDTEIIANSEAVKETVEAVADAATEELANLDNGTVKFAVGIGVGVLATVVVAKYVVPKVKRGFKCFKSKYVKYRPVKADEELTEEEAEMFAEMFEEDDEEPGEEDNGK